MDNHRIYGRLRKWWKRVYGQYKTLKALLYIKKEVDAILWFKYLTPLMGRRVKDYLDAGEIILEARERLSTENE